MSHQQTDCAVTFLEGGGHMGACIRAFDWETTPLGPPATWPATLAALVRVMLASRQPMFITWGPERTMLYNDGYAPLCGSKHPWALGRPFAEVWSDILDAVGPIADRAYAGVPTHMDDIAFTMRDRHGHDEEAHFEFSYTPVREDSGAVAGMFCACNETTERVFFERRLRALVELNDRIRHTSDPGAIMALASEIVGRYLGTARAGFAELEASTGALAVTCDWTDGRVASLTGTPGGTQLARIVEALRGAEMVWVDDAGADARLAAHAPALAERGVASLVVAPLAGEGGGRSAFFAHGVRRHRWRDEQLAVVRDVAERAWDAVRRARSERDLREEHRRKDEFLATLAHELRNPLAPLRTGLELLGELDPREADAARIRQRMHRQFAHLVRLIDDLLDLSRVSRGLIELRKEVVDLATVVQEAVETSRPLISAGHHELDVRLPPTPLHVEADPVRLTQVFGNLLNNAAKYTPRGGRISLAVAREGDEVVVRVSDTGVGIPPEMLRSVFEMFTQIRDSSVPVQDGLGVGLTLVRRLTQLHGGTVSAESDGRGSTFTVRLPEAVSAAATEPRVRGGVVTDNLSPRGGGSALRVLVVDDNTDAVEMLTMLVELQGHQTDRAYCGQAALEACGRFRPDVVFLDIGLPDMDGYEVARELRRREGDAVRLIALTGWGSDEDRRRSREAGFDHHLTKPADPDDIARLLTQVRPEPRA
jgi:signal transduction histidine kinase